MAKGKKKPNKEKRVHTRYSAEIPVEYQVLEEQKEIESFQEHLEKVKRATTKDVSLGGMYIATNHALKKGSIIQLEMMISHHGKKLKTFAQVVWTDKLGGGLKIFIMSDDDRKWLKSYLEKHFPK